MVLIDVVRLVGVVVAMLGAVITAPAGTRQLLNSLLDVARRSARFVLRHLPWHDRSVTVHGATTGVVVSVLPGLTQTESGTVWSPNAPLAEQIERLRQRTDDLSRELQRLRADHRDDVAALRSELDRLKADHQGQLAVLRAEQAARDRQAAKIDATGLPLIGLGIVLTGWPDQWLPPALAAFFLLAAVVLVAITLKQRTTR